MIELNDLVEQTSPIEIELDGFVLKGVVRLNGITTTFARENLKLKETTEDGAEKEVVNPDYHLMLLARSYKSLDITENGKPFEVTVENLKRLPMTLIDELSESLGEKRRELKKKRSTPQSDTSSPAAG